MTELEKLIAREKAKHDLTALELCVVINKTPRLVREKAVEQLAKIEAVVKEAKKCIEHWSECETDSLLDDAMPKLEALLDKPRKNE